MNLSVVLSAIPSENSEATGTGIFWDKSRFSFQFPFDDFSLGLSSSRRIASSGKLLSRFSFMNFLGIRPSLVDFPECAARREC